MQSEWIRTTWGELATLEYGKALRGYENGAGPYRVFGTNGAIGWHDVPLADGPSVIVGRKGAYRGVHYASEPFFVIDTAFYLKPKTPFDMRWAYYQLLTQDIDAMDSGSAIPSTSRDAFYRLPVLVPPPAQQARIALILGTLDDKIAANHQTSASLEKIAQSLFQAWFANFLPVRAKVAARALGRDPVRAAMAAITGKDESGLDTIPRDQSSRMEAITALFPDRLVDSEIGRIPEGWRVETVGTVAAYLNRGISPKYTDAAGVLVVNQRCVRDNTVDFGKARRHDNQARAVGGRELQIGDVLINSTGVGTLGRVAQVLHLPEPTIPDSHVTVVRTGPAVTWNYLGLELARRQAEIEQLGEGSTGQTELSRSKLSGLIMVVPPRPLQERFDELTLPLRDRISLNLRENETLAQLRDALLPRLVSGEISMDQPL